MLRSGEPMTSATGPTSLSWKTQTLGRGAGTPRLRTHRAQATPVNRPRHLRLRGNMTCSVDA